MLLLNVYKTIARALYVYKIHDIGLLHNELKELSCSRSFLKHFHRSAYSKQLWLYTSIVVLWSACMLLKHMISKGYVFAEEINSSVDFKLGFAFISFYDIAFCFLVRVRTV